MNMEPSLLMTPTSRPWAFSPLEIKFQFNKVFAFLTAASQLLEHTKHILGLAKYLRNVYPRVCRAIWKPPLEAFLSQFSLGKPIKNNIWASRTDAAPPYQLNDSRLDIQVSYISWGFCKMPPTSKKAGGEWHNDSCLMPFNSSTEVSWICMLLFWPTQAIAQPAS